MGPFDRFNDRAKRVLALAQDEAVRFAHNYIGPEHLLLGLVRETEGVAARALGGLGVELSKVRTFVEFTIGRGDTSAPSEITLSPRTKKIIELAIDEARKLGHSHVGTEHLLLGLVREGGSMGAKGLESLGLTLEQVRHQVIATLNDPEARRGVHRQPRRYGERAPSADQVLALAADEARALGHDWIGTEHLLLGLVRCESTHAGRVLRALGITYERARAEVIAAVPAREGRPDQVALTPRAQETVGYAKGFADGGGTTFSAETLLLALASDAEGIGGRTLLKLGATPLTFRTALERLLLPPSA